eukprot:TRINITY_DN4794_c1_g1_i1.p1 TRINITY_DN4794_c1_g1~~TRINITY_DN4794_c1_g1_i1.p1  ORF type:complete len:967 (+),score=180.96 TRINITY_DN4794_c1_g1_i1:88-2901(+)
MTEEKKSKYKILLKEENECLIAQKEDRREAWTACEDPFVSSGGKKVEVKLEWRQTSFETHSTKIQTMREHQVLSRLNWMEQKKEVLTKFTTNKNIPVHSKIIEDDIAKDTGNVTQVDKAKQRLEELSNKDKDASEEKKDKVSYYSQADLIAHLEKLANELEMSWQRQEKVKALRIVIQACKLLSTINVPQCYPSLFVLTAKVLDVFGDLVYERIYQRALETLGVKKLPDCFQPSDISPETKDMCRNWFYKIASIRELIPRILVEMALWKCNRFLLGDIAFFNESLARFAKQIRGIGDNLLSAHARFYLCRKGLELDGLLGGALQTTYAKICLSDFYYCRVLWEPSALEKVLASSQMTREQYIALFSPVARWLIEQNAQRTNTVESLKSQIEAYKEGGKFSMCLEHIIGSYDGTIVRDEIALIVSEIEDASCDTCTKYDLWVALGKALLDAPPEAKSDRRTILNNAWGCLEDSLLPEYMKAAIVWFEYSVHHLDKNDVNLLLKNIYDRVKSTRAFDEQQKSLQHILRTVLSHEKWNDLMMVFSLDSFLPILDVLEADVKKEMCLEILTRFAKSGSYTGDQVLIGSLLDIARSLHDKLTMMSTDDDRRDISTLILSFLSKVDFGKDHDAHLNLYVECRRSFYKLCPVIAECVHGTLRLLQRILRSHKIKSHSRKLGVFAKCCLTFCHVTIPSIMDPVLRVRCLLATGFTGMSHGFLSHGEALIASALQAVHDMSGSEETSQIEELLPVILGDIKLASCADKNGIWLIQEVLQMAEGRDWDNMTSTKGLIMVKCLKALVALYQSRLEIGEECGEEFSEIATTTTNTAMVELVRLSQLLEDAATPPGQHPKIKSLIAELSLALFSCVGSHVTIEAKIPGLLSKLWAIFSDSVSSMLNSKQVSYSDIDEKISCYIKEGRNVLASMQSSSDESLVAAVRGLTL